MEVNGPEGYVNGTMTASWAIINHQSSIANSISIDRTKSLPKTRGRFRKWLLYPAPAPRQRVTGCNPIHVLDLVLHREHLQRCLKMGALRDTMLTRILKWFSHGNSIQRCEESYALWAGSIFQSILHTPIKPTKGSDRGVLKPRNPTQKNRSFVHP